ncbi:MAG: oxalurate catabolism protein HpxZ [Betaproteobacteria bacterium]
MEINIPDVVAEVTAAFNRYEHALNENEVKTLDDSFWASPHTVRYGQAENLYGRDEILAFRKGRSSVGIKRRLLRTVITTFGHDFATASCEFQRIESGRRGRQMQTWVRMPEGWRVVAAHVSWYEPPA